jgi:hypothetical protein
MKWTSGGYSSSPGQSFGGGEMELKAGKGVVQIGVLAGSFYRAREGGGGSREGRVATVMAP